MRCVLALVIAWALCGRVSAAEPDPEAARALASKARDALRDNAPEEAADWFDQADAVAPHPIWRLAAGDAWLQAGEPAVARARFEAAIAGGIDGEARVDAAGKRELADTLAPIVERARALTKAADYVRAMRAWDEAFAVMPLGRFLVAAARAADNGGRDVDLARLVRIAEPRTDLAAEDRRWVASVIARTAPVPPVRVEQQPAVAPSPVGPSVLVGVGGAIAVGGIVALLVGDDAWSDVREMKAGVTDGVVFSATRAEAESRADEARAWTMGGWVGVGVGVVMAAVGGGWLLGGQF